MPSKRETSKGHPCLVWFSSTCRTASRMCSMIRSPCPLSLRVPVCFGVTACRTRVDAKESCNAHIDAHSRPRARVCRRTMHGQVPNLVATRPLLLSWMAQVSVSSFTTTSLLLLHHHVRICRSTCRMNWLVRILSCEGKVFGSSMRWLLIAYDCRSKV